MNDTERPTDAQERAPDQPPAGTEAEAHVPAWEQIEAGRFMPRRIRGSFRGAKLG